MKVLYLITRADLGGAQVHLVDLIAGLRGKVQPVLGVGEEGYLTSVARRMGVEHHVLPELVHPISPLKDARALRRMVQLIGHVRPHLIHAHTSKAGVLGRLAAGLAGVPAVFTAHTWAFAEGTSLKWRAFGIPSERLAARFSSRIINVSAANRGLALRHRIGDERKHLTIYNGVPDTALRARPGDDGVPGFIMVARFVPQKAQGVLLQAVARLDRPVRLTFVGDGPLRAAQELEARRLGIQERVAFLGERRDIPELLSQNHVFVLATNWEGFPLSILEAMRAGLPVVSTDVGGVREAIIPGETGFVLPDNDPQTWCACLQSLLDSPALRQRLGDAARARYESLFTLSGMARQTLAVYRSIVPQLVADDADPGSQKTSLPSLLSK